ncbi:antichymotrypsin-2-like isoform X2 [Anoplolepis gracilipes]|uniref:antichymotrypsin-2-like isoform X2 n=1 Tax=Anoplolepis gracilipes TaxID=354296 RepID=UPI003BA1EF39
MHTALFAIIIVSIICNTLIMFIEALPYSTELNTFKNVSTALVTYMEFKNISNIKNQNLPVNICEEDLISLLLSLIFEHPGYVDESAIEEMESFIQFINKLSLNVKFETLITLLTDIESTDMHVEIAAYISNKNKLSTNFLSICKHIHKNILSISNIDFQDNIRAAETVNLWVQEKTNNKILNIIFPSDIDTDIKIMIVQIVHFNSRLLNAFDERNTERLEFHISPIKKYFVPTIQFEISTYICGQIPDWHMMFIEIPFLDKNAKMIIFLPNKEIELHDLEKKINFLEYQNYRNISQDVSYDLELYLPNFKFESFFNWKYLLQEMNKMYPFEKYFPYFTNNSLKVGNIIQKISVQMEESSIAATGSMRRPYIFQEEVNRDEL